MGKIYRNGKTITPTNYIEKVNNSLIEGIIDRTAKSVDLSETNITQIGNYALSNFDTVYSFFFPNSLKKFNFASCSSNSYLNRITGIENVTNIGSNAFSGCSRLSLSELPEGLNSIGTYAFRSCSSVSITRLPAGIREITEGAFNYCTGIENITFAGNISKIGNYAYNQCSKLSKIVFPNNSAVPTLSSTNAFQNTSSELIIYVPDALYDTWIVATNWATYASKIKKISEMPTE